MENIPQDSLSGRTVSWRNVFLSVFSGYDYEVCQSFGVVVITTKVYCYIIAMVSYVYSQSLAMATQILVGYFKGAGIMMKLINVSNLQFQ